MQWCAKRKTGNFIAACIVRHSFRFRLVNEFYAYKFYIVNLSSNLVKIESSSLIRTRNLAFRYKTVSTLKCIVVNYKCKIWRLWMRNETTIHRSKSRAWWACVEDLCNNNSKVILIWGQISRECSIIDRQLITLRSNAKSQQQQQQQQQQPERKCAECFDSNGMNETTARDQTLCTLIFKQTSHLD